MRKLLVLFLLGSNIISNAQEIDLFIWCGQSNALGRQGDAAGYPADPDELDNDIMFNWQVIDGSNSGGWIFFMGPQVGYFADGHFGPEVTFSRSLVEAGYNPAIFKYTKGATSIFEHWLTPGDGGFYDDMVSDLNVAIEALEDLGHTVNIRGFIWIQGESDSGSPEAADAYFDNLESIISDIRTVTEVDTLPILLGVDEDFFTLLGFQEPEILQAHLAIASDDPNIKFTSMYGFPKADVTHLTPAGLILHGESVFETYQLLLSGEKPTSNCTITSDGDIASILDARSWGQSFSTDCSGILSSVMFSAASELSNSAIMSIHNGADCTGEIIFSEALSSIVMGDNTISVPAELELYIEKEHTYYINITSDLTTEWKVFYSNTDNVAGCLKTSRDGEIATSCNRLFPDFDLKFSVELSVSTMETEEYSKNSILLFPNPSNGIVNVALNENFSVKVYDLLGNTILNETNLSGGFELSNCKQGIYIVEIILVNGKSHKQKIVVK